jgi:hypothetical protein
MGKAGRSIITRSTYDLVALSSTANPPEPSRGKGAGAVEVWRVIGRKGGRPAEATLRLKERAKADVSKDGPAITDLSYTGFVLRGSFATPLDKVLGRRSVPSNHLRLGSS